MHIAFELLKHLSEILPGLSGVASRQQAAELRALARVRESRWEISEIPLSLTREQVAEIVVDEKGAVRTTPAGARLLVDLYRRDKLLRRKHSVEIRVEPFVLEYIASEADLVARTRALEAKKEQAMLALANPDTVPEIDFNHGLLVALFNTFATPSESTLLLGGVRVTRYVSRVSTMEVGKPKHPAVAFRWLSPDGTPKEARK